MKCKACLKKLDPNRKIIVVKDGSLYNYFCSYSCSDSYPTIEILLNRIRILENKVKVDKGNEYFEVKLESLNNNLNK